MGGLTLLTPSTPQPLHSLSGVLRLATGNFTFSTSYPTGGEAFNPQTSFGTGAIRRILVVDVPSAGGYTFEWDQANGRLIAYTSVGTQPTGTNLGLLGSIPWLAVGA